MFMPYLTGGWYGLGLVGMLLHMILWGAFVVVIAYFIIRMLRGAKGYDTENNALNILKKRYAAGEINEEEFDRMKDRVK